MKCENYFCIYEKDGTCVLDSIEIDIQGSCKECMYIDVDEGKLQMYKEKERDKLSNRLY